MSNGLESRTSLGLLFLTAPFLDLILFRLIPRHIESLTMLANATASAHSELLYRPFSHRIWASLFGLLNIYYWPKSAYLDRSSPSAKRLCTKTPQINTSKSQALKLTTLQTQPRQVLLADSRHATLAWDLYLLISNRVDSKKRSARTELKFRFT